MTPKIKIQIRYNHNTKHHSAVVAEEGDTYDNFTLTHSDNTSGRENIKLKQNPNPNDDEPSYLVPRLRNHKKNKFDREKRNWQLDPDDEEMISVLYDNKKKTDSSNS